jgi:hypothetical protein
VADHRVEPGAVTAVVDARRLRRHRRQEPVAAHGVDATPGALVAVCGLHGGAGTTGTTAAVAVAAASSSPPGAILAVEAAATAGDLAECVGVGSPWSLARLATLAAAGSLPDVPPFAERPDGLRVLAAAQPDLLTADGSEVAAVLGEARRAHVLVVCDAGDAGAAPAAHCLSVADAVLWVARAERLDASLGRLSGPLARPARGAPWGLVVYGGRPPRRTLAAIRDDVSARVVLPQAAGSRETGATVVALVRRLVG